MSICCYGSAAATRLVLLAMLLFKSLLGLAADVPPVSETRGNLSAGAAVYGQAAPSLDTLDSAVNGVGQTMEAKGSSLGQKVEERYTKYHDKALADTHRGRQSAAMASANRYRQDGLAQAGKWQKQGKALTTAGRGLGYAQLAGTAVQATDAHLRGDIETRDNLLIQQGVETLADDGGRMLATSIGGPAMGAVYSGGHALGTAVRQIDTCVFADCEPGEVYTVQDGVTDFYVSVKESYDDFTNRWNHRADANALRAQHQSSALIDDQRQRDLERQQQVAASPSPSGPDGFQSFMDSLMNGVILAEQLNSAGGSGPCHPGHDEQAHPGGCHEPPLN